MTDIPNWICTDCGQRLGKYRVGTSTYHNGTCGYCEMDKPVTSSRDYSWPEKEKKK